MPRIHPDPDEFARAFTKGRTPPVWAEVIADYDTPVSAFARIARGDHAFLLESVEGGELWGRYSVFGAEPWAVYTHQAGAASLRTPAGETLALPVQANDPLGGLREILAVLPPLADTDGSTPGRLIAGAIGYLAYDAVRYYERIPLPGQAVEPDAMFVLPEWLCIYDRLTNRIRIVALPIRRRADGSPAWTDAEAAYAWARDCIRELASRLRAPLARGAPSQRAVHLNDFTPDRAAFEAAVERAREYIAAGDVIQVVLSRRRTGRTDVDPFDIYRALRLVNPSPYMFFLRLGSRTLAGSSPEVLARVDGGIVTTRPIAGTRPRGRSPDEDAARAAELLADPKERAEHLMLVDLGRNDVGRVAQVGSVEVTRFMEIERYSHVMHLVSDVVGRLRPGEDACDALASIFPAGTLSGAPKVRAMEIISELEPARRGVYGGAVGYVGLDGNADTCIAIRTIELVGDEVRIQAGAGIVHDSRPAAEADETEAKAAAMEAALHMAAEGL